MNNRLRNVIKTVNKCFKGEHNGRLYFPNWFAFVTISINNKRKRIGKSVMDPWIDKEDMMS